MVSTGSVTNAMRMSVEVLSLTMKPITARSDGVLGSNPTSKNSCKLPAARRATSTINTKPVTAKKPRKLMRRLPFTKRMPNNTAPPHPGRPADQAHQVRRLRQRERGQKEDHLHAFAEDHEEHKRQQTPALSPRLNVRCGERL